MISLDPQEELSLKAFRLYNEFASRLHRQRTSRRIGRTAGIAAGGTTAAAAGAAIADAILYNGANAEAIRRFVDEEVIPVILLMGPQEYLEYGLLGVTLATVGYWAFDQMISTSYRKRQLAAEAVLNVPHASKQSEQKMFNRRTGRSDWDTVRDLYFGDTSYWSEAARITSALYDQNLRFTGHVSDDIVHGRLYRRLTIDEILEGVGAECSITSYSDIGLPLPKQLNQGQVYLEGIIAEIEGKLPEFLSPEVIVQKLPDGRYVIGSIGTDPSRHGCNHDDMTLISVLHPFFPGPGEGLRIGVVTEGTYPFVRGGVATVIDDMMRGLEPGYLDADSVTFEAVSLWANQGPFNTKVSYPIPDFIHLNMPINIYGYSDNPAFQVQQPLHEEIAAEILAMRPGRRQRESARIRHDGIKYLISCLEDVIANEDIEGFYRMAEYAQHFSIQEMTSSAAALEGIYEQYHLEDPALRPSFMEYLFFWQSLREPLLRVIKADKIKADLMYTVMTGLGGVYSALTKRLLGIGMVCTEHGIYKEDRDVEIANSSLPKLFRDKWKQAFAFYSKLTYDAADSITTTCACNSYKQLRDGAPPEKITVIPGSLSVGEMPEEWRGETFIFAECGNVQRVKRIEIFLEAAKLVLDALPGADIEFRVMGRDDPRDPAYVSQVHGLADTLGLTRPDSQGRTRLSFAPYSDYVKAFQPVKAAILCSASEVQPRSVMEALSLGIPVITPDVGGCKELLYGSDGVGEPIDDLGYAGIVVPLGSPRAMVKGTADAMLALYFRDRLRHGMDPGLIPQSVVPYLDEAMKHSMEEIGFIRMKNYCERRVVIPQYAERFKEAMR